jgi:hypothetical protein
MFFLTTKTRRPLGCGKSRSVESEENQKQVSLASHRPWKSRTTRGIPTFPTAPTAAGISQTTSGNLIVVDRKECLTPDTRYCGVVSQADTHHDQMEALCQCQKRLLHSGVGALSLNTVLPEIFPEPSTQADPNNENASKEHHEIADAKQSQLSLVR